jgi:hypothetical protein
MVEYLWVGSRRTSDPLNHIIGALRTVPREIPYQKPKLKGQVRRTCAAIVPGQGVHLPGCTSFLFSIT